MEILSILLGLLAFSAVGKADSREATDEEFPFQVSVQTEEGRHLCGGSIITSSWILTISDCISRSGISQDRLMVACGSAESHKPKQLVRSARIEHEGVSVQKRGRLALIRLEKALTFSKVVAHAKLPTPEAKLINSTKLSGWKLDHLLNLPPNLHVIDKFNVITEDCRTPSGAPVKLESDEFCGIDEESPDLFMLTNQGTAVSKKAIVIGLLQEVPRSMSPPIFIKVSEHGQWIKDVLGQDAQFIHWVDKIPNNSAVSRDVMSLALVGLSTLFLLYF